MQRHIAAANGRRARQRFRPAGPPPRLISCRLTNGPRRRTAEGRGNLNEALVVFGRVCRGCGCWRSLSGTGAAFSQANEDDVAARQAKYPLAAKAGEDSHAIDKAPAGALNQGKFDDKTWKFGHAYDAPAGSKLWNPAKIKMLAGGMVTGGTVFSRHRSGNLLRHGQCRLRLHLDRASA